MGVQLPTSTGAGRRISEPSINRYGYEFQEYLEMIGLASFMALACFFVPKRRFTATSQAAVWGQEATEVTQVLVILDLKKSGLSKKNQWKIS